MSIEKEIFHLDEHIVVLGYNSRVERVVEELAGEGLKGEDNPLLIVADREECPAARASHVHFCGAHPAREETLKKIKLSSARVVLVMACDGGGEDLQAEALDAQTVLTVISLQKYFSMYFTEGQNRPRVIAECLEESTLEHLKNAGCDETIMIGSTSASLLAASVINPGITDFFGEIFSTLEGNEFYISSAPSEIIGLSYFRALKKMKVKYGSILVAIQRGSHIHINPRRFVLRTGDRLVVLAPSRPRYKTSLASSENSSGEESHV